MLDFGVYAEARMGWSVLVPGVGEKLILLGQRNFTQLDAPKVARRSNAMKILGGVSFSRNRERIGKALGIAEIHERNLSLRHWRKVEASIRIRHHRRRWDSIRWQSDPST